MTKCPRPSTSILSKALDTPYSRHRSASGFRQLPTMMVPFELPADAGLNFTSTAVRRRRCPPKQRRHNSVATGTQGWDGLYRFSDDDLLAKIARDPRLVDFAVVARSHAPSPEGHRITQRHQCASPNIARILDITGTPDYFSNTGIFWLDDRLGAGIFARFNNAAQQRPGPDFRDVHRYTPPDISPAYHTPGMWNVAISRSSPWV